jgi:hypothetical protein
MFLYTYLGIFYTTYTSFIQICKTVHYYLLIIFSTFLYKAKKQSASY